MEKIKRVDERHYHSNTRTSHQPVVGIILMVTTTVILAVVIAAFIFGFSNSQPTLSLPTTFNITVKDKYIDIEDDSNEYYILTTGNDIRRLVSENSRIKGPVIKVYNEIEIGKTYSVEYDTDYWGYPIIADSVREI